MAVDRITKDMRQMAQSYSSQKPRPLMQDKARPVRQDKPVRPQREKQTARDASNSKTAAMTKYAVKSANDNVIKGSQAAAGSIQKGFEGLKARNNLRHREVMGSMRERTSLMRGMNSQLGGIHGMLFKEMYGPKVEPYKREDAGVSQLANQLGQQHRDIMQELEKIRKALLQGGGGGGGLFGGGWRGGQRGGRNNRGGNRGRRGSRWGGGGGGSNNSSNSSSSNNRTNASSTSSSSSTRTTSSNNSGGSSSSWGRANSGTNAGGGGNSWLDKLGKTKHGKIIAGVATGGAAILTGMNIMGRNDAPEPSAPASSGSNSSYSGAASGSYSGVGSISAAAESTRGVHEISSGRGDNGGVSYGTHQLASRNGSMAAFLQSPEGQPYAGFFNGLAPGSNQFSEVYRQVAVANEAEFAKAQKDYINRTHYEPMQNNVMRGSGFDASQRGPAIQEMLYSTGVQYGAGTTVINRAFEGVDPNSLTDEQIINRVQDYKAATTDTYFKSSAPNVRISVARRHAGPERQRLLALNAQHQNGELEQPQTPQTATAVASAPEPLNQPSSASPMLGDESDGNALLAAAGGTALLASGAGVMRASPTPAANTAQSTPAASAPPSLTAPSAPTPAASAARSPAPPALLAAPTPATGGPTVTGASTAPVATAPAPSSAADPSKAGKWDKLKGGARRIPGISIGLGALDVADVMTDDSLSGGEKAGAITDIAGGTVGGMAGAQAGAMGGAALGLLGGPAAPVTVPVGAAIGGIAGGVAGYWAGSNITNSARGWANRQFGWFGDGDEEQEEPKEARQLPANHPLEANRRREAQLRRNRANNTSGGESEASPGAPESFIAVDAIASANQIAAGQMAEVASISGTALAAVSAVQAAQTDPTQPVDPVVVNNFPVQGENNPTGAPESEVAGASQVSQSPVVPGESQAQQGMDADDSMMLNAASQMIFGQSLPDISNTRMDAPEHMRQNLHGSSSTSSAPSVSSATRSAAPVVAVAAGAGVAAGVDEEDSFLLNAASQMLFGRSLPSISNTRMEAPEHMQKNLHGYGNEIPTVQPSTLPTQASTYGASPNQREVEPAGVRPEPVAPAPAPTTTRDGNSVTHDFTQRSAPVRNTGSEITESDLTTRPVANTPFRPENQINLDINRAHAAMSVMPMSARQASSSPAPSVGRGHTAPAPGTAPDFLGNTSTAVSSSVPSSMSQQNVRSGVGVSDVSTQTVSDIPPQRQQYDSVQKVMMMEPKAPPKERQDLTAEARSASTTSTFEGRNHQPSIDDTPALVSDFGLTLLNTGFI